MSKNLNEIFIRSDEIKVEKREDGEGPRIVGYAAKFNTRSNNLGGFVEVIAPGAFDDVLDDDVRALFNHDRNFVLGRTKAGTLTLTVDEVGLRYEITPPDTQTVRDMVIEPMDRGDVSQSSFAFRLPSDGYRWDEDDDGVYVRTITRVSKLLDVSPVTIQLTTTPKPVPEPLKKRARLVLTTVKNSANWRSIKSSSTAIGCCKPCKTFHYSNRRKLNEIP
ncbi:HK97 family phage prohead protease [Vibrio diabolicus]|uniref:HK97 family phage prohead protease n=1 Tax=Vibrio diabolicus TaxID=50719 RepID=UPI001C7108DA|nr:HK97 family phage prohead protease [Vibrio diabolicus]